MRCKTRSNIDFALVHFRKTTIFMVANTIPWLPYKTNLLILSNCNCINNSKQIVKLPVAEISPKKNKGIVM